jgi:hypothetical protein
MAMEAKKPMTTSGRFIRNPLGNVQRRDGRRLLQGVLLVASLSACGGLEQQFIGSRILDQCNGQWNVCDTTVGCFLGDANYVSGRFPGTNKVAVTLFEPSQVTATFYPTNTGGAGSSTSVNFYETACTSRIRLTTTGVAFMGEAQQTGFVVKSADLSGVGDHLIEVDSDARTEYLLKLDVLPLRLRDAPSGN